MCFGGGLVFLTLRDLDTDLFLLSLLLGVARGVLLLVVGLGRESSFSGVISVSGNFLLGESFQGIFPFLQVCGQLKPSLRLLW